MRQRNPLMEPCLRMDDSDKVQIEIVLRDTLDTPGRLLIVTENELVPGHIGEAGAHVADDIPVLRAVRAIDMVDLAVLRLRVPVVDHHLEDQQAGELFLRYAGIFALIPVQVVALRIREVDLVFVMPLETRSALERT